VSERRKPGPAPPPGELPADGVGLRVPGQRRQLAGAPVSVLAAAAAGGALGSLTRWGLGQVFPPGRIGFPWATFGINVSGCLLIGMLMVAVTEVWPGRRLVRPFLGVGVLGGYTTFSTYIVDIRRLVDAGAPATASAYLAGTVLAALAATYAGIAFTRRLIFRRRR
jgi:CrcB protein